MNDPSQNSILVTGGRGFIGAALVAALGKAGFRPRPGVRNPGSPSELACDLDDFAQMRAAREAQLAKAAR